MIRSLSVGGVSEQGDMQFAKKFGFIKFLIGYEVTWYLNRVSCISMNIWLQRKQAHL